MAFPQGNSFNRYYSDLTNAELESIGSLFK